MIDIEHFNNIDQQFKDFLIKSNQYLEIRMTTFNHHGFGLL